ncbi:electron transfer flavoprotein subunit alpha/FixB family protein [Caballeronia sp. dw_276]|jgi:electron transfer flavoprotein alpha subunit|uniref:electron transfer flavoprotein subunit alpha/FixB family protein n=1 Tax=Caballeronia sp. dw_276 TaxID=2719795 RepID=UPI001BD29356|nr:electron transfer flavoprotein subunit alpha/FixB family protein [Caballeronia sp. dw_276]
MHTIKRIDPRRPFSVTAEGLKRITLGVIGAAGDVELAALGGHREQAKPRRTMSAALRSLLVAAHSDRGSLDDHARQTLAAVALLADAATQVVLLVFGELTDDAAVLGADKVIAMPAFDRRAFTPDAALNALAACIAAYSPLHIFLPDNATGDGDLGRRYAAQAKATVATQVVEIDAAHVAVYTQTRKAYAVRELPDVILLAPNAVDARLPFVGAGEQVDAEQFAIASAQTASPYKDLGVEEIDAAQVALEEADFIVSAGNGVTDVPAFERLASTVGAAIGASRVAVDDGKFPRDKQIGATGKTVDASIYIAFGISGAVQHLQGIKDCRHVIAVNLDASAPIAKRANLTIIGDAAETIAALTDAAAAARSARANPGAQSAHGEGVPNAAKLEGALA